MSLSVHQQEVLAEVQTGARIKIATRDGLYHDFRYESGFFAASLNGRPIRAATVLALLDQHKIKPCRRKWRLTAQFKATSPECTSEPGDG